MELGDRILFRQNPEQCCLAAPVRADQPKANAWSKVEVQVAEQDSVAELHFQTLGVNEALRLSARGAEIDLRRARDCS